MRMHNQSVHTLILKLLAVWDESRDGLGDRTDHKLGLQEIALPVQTPKESKNPNFKPRFPGK